jgi:hypothetical protein
MALLIISSIINGVMSPFDLRRSQEEARRRLGGPVRRSTRAPRSDRGHSRLSQAVLECVGQVLSGRDRPRTKDLLRDLEELCRDRGLKPPSRATVYKLMATLPGPGLRKADLPVSVQRALHNLAPESVVPAHQVAFCCFHHGDLRAVAFAAGLPWLAIHQARLMRGYRRKSRGLVEAVARARGV